MIRPRGQEVLHQNRSSTKAKSAMNTRISLGIFATLSPQEMIFYVRPVGSPNMLDNRGNPNMNHFL